VRGGQLNRSGEYRGPDRRQRIPDGHAAVGSRLLLVAVAVAVLAVIGGWVLTSSSDEHSLLCDLGDAIATTAAAVFFAAGLLRLVRWRLTGEATVALRGAALVVFGGLNFPREFASTFIHRSELASEFSPLTRLVATAAMIVLLCLAVRTTEVHAGLNPRILAGAGLAASFSLYLGLVALRQLGHLNLDPPPGMQAALELAMAAGWAALAAGYLRRGQGRRRSSDLWTGASISLLALAGVARALAVFDLALALVCAAGLEAGAAAIALSGATGDLRQVLAHEGNRLLSVAGMLRDAEHHLSAEERRREEQIHDVRSAIAALRAATVTLQRYGGGLEEERRSELRSAIVDELGRLQYLVEAGGEKPRTDFTLAQAIGPVIAAERENGLVIDAHLAPVPVRGRPEDVATVFQHLLVNARRHAPGSAVLIRSRSAGPHLVVSISDRGPGVPEAEREAVFGRGTRGTNSCGSAGSGLGLYLARRLMVEQGGTIEVEERDGGGARFVLSFPLGSVDRELAGAVSGAG
jgi:signal transduction histidine kinase